MRAYIPSGALRTVAVLHTRFFDPCDRRWDTSSSSEKGTGWISAIPHTPIEIAITKKRQLPFTPK
jgi:hypothetical protein